jgi:hypothetical protein
LYSDIDSDTDPKTEPPNKPELLSSGSESELSPLPKIKKQKTNKQADSPGKPEGCPQPDSILPRNPNCGQKESESGRM